MAQEDILESQAILLDVDVLFDCHDNQAVDDVVVRNG